MNRPMEQDIERILITKEELEEKVAEIGRKISEDYADTKEDIVFIGVLKGCFVFMADLMRHVTVPCCMDFMAVSSYGSGTTSSGAVEITKDLREDIGGKWRKLTDKNSFTYKKISEKISSNVKGTKKGWNIIIILDTGERIKTNTEPVSIEDVQEAIGVLVKPSILGMRIKSFEIIAE